MTRDRSAYSFDGDLMRIALVAVVVGVVVGVVVHFAGVGSPVIWGVFAGIISTLVIGPLSGRRPARSNSST